MSDVHLYIHVDYISEKRVSECDTGIIVQSVDSVCTINPHVHIIMCIVH